jgi:platelet-activating factor acetylhydrolase
LEQLSIVLSSLDAGKTFTNYAAHKQQPITSLGLKDTLDLRPGRITWAGHSFGAATTVQFVKSVYYHQSLPSLKGTQYENDENWRPIYTPAENTELTNQITPDTPIALLDLWTMPLRGESTKWLWEKPLPSYDRRASAQDTPNVVAIMSSEFHRWSELLSRTKAVLAPDPAKALKRLEHSRSSSAAGMEHNSDIVPLATPPNKTPVLEAQESDHGVESPFEHQSPQDSSSSSSSSSRSTSPSPASSTTSISSSEANGSRSSSSTSPHLYHIPQSAHLSQSDFGVLFPNLTRYLMKAQDPTKTIELNVRAILAVMRGAGLEVEGYGETEDDLLRTEGREERFVRVPLE